MKPSIPFEAKEFEYLGKRIFMVIIPSSKSIPTKYRDDAFIRIGSSKEKLNKYPEYEVKLSNILAHGFPTITNTAAPDYAQELTFEKLFMYYAAKGIALKKETFEKNLKLRTVNNEYNIMAYILSDQNGIPVRVSVFSGKEKYDPLFSVKEFGNTCIMYSMDKILEYGDAINIIQADERNRISERRDVPLFNYEAFHEAVLNAFIHNKWLTLNAPSISIFTDRIEIVSNGGLSADQDLDGFYSGTSLPVNEILASIFLQLRISERSGRGVPKIIHAYGKEAFKIERNRIIVTIPFNKIKVNNFEIVSDNVYQKVTNKYLNKSQTIIVEMIRDNPYVTINQIALKTKLSEAGVKKNLRILKEKRYIERIGSNKGGYWEVII